MHSASTFSVPNVQQQVSAEEWQARVDLLRQAVGFESTQRLVASRGDPAMLLVSVD